MKSLHRHGNGVGMGLAFLSPLVQTFHIRTDGFGTVARLYVCMYCTVEMMILST